MLLQDHTFTVSHKIKLTHLKLNAIRSQWPGTTTLMPAVSCLQCKVWTLIRKTKIICYLLQAKKDQSS